MSESTFSKVQVLIRCNSELQGGGKKSLVIYVCFKISAFTFRAVLFLFFCLAHLKYLVHVSMCVRMCVCVCVHMRACVCVHVCTIKMLVFLSLVVQLRCTC